MNQEMGNPDFSVHGDRGARTMQMNKGKDSAYLRPDSDTHAGMRTGIYLRTVPVSHGKHAGQNVSSVRLHKRDGIPDTELVFLRKLRISVRSYSVYGAEINRAGIGRRRFIFHGFLSGCSEEEAGRAVPSLAQANLLRKHRKHRPILLRVALCGVDCEAIGPCNSRDIQRMLHAAFHFPAVDSRGKKLGNMFNHT